MNEAAVVILRRKDGAVLMQHRDNNPGVKFPDYWALPGGKSEGEHPRVTAIREIEEETGYVLKEADLTLVGQKSQQIGDRLVWRSFYLAIYDGVQQIQCNEGQAMEFVHPQEFDSMKIIEDHVSFIGKTEERLSSRNRNKERR